MFFSLISPGTNYYLNDEHETYKTCGNVLTDGWTVQRLTENEKSVLPQVPTREKM